MKNVLRLLCMLVLVLTMIFGGVQVSPQAAVSNPLKGMPKIKKVIIGTWEELEVREPTVGTYQTPEYKTKVKIKATSSNKKIAKVISYTSEYKGKYYGVYSVRNLKGKPGTVKIKVTVRINGKTYKKTATYVFEKYRNPLKSIKINGKSYTSLFNKNALISTKQDIFSGKLAFKAKRGYKITKIIGLRNKGKNYTVKNNSKLKSGTRAFFIKYQNTKTKVKGTSGINTYYTDYFPWY